jgi:MATE family multidrug resistance protein
MAFDLRREIRILSRLALPVVASQVAAMMLWMVDLLMVGRVGVEAIGAVSLGRSWLWLSMTFGLGLVLGIDPVASQAKGARDRRTMGLAVQWGLVVAALVSVPIAVAYLFTESFLVATGQDPGQAALAGRYVMVQIPAIPFFLGFIALRQWLQGRGIMRPAMWMAFAANGINILVNWLLIFGHWGFPALGAVGAGWATTCSQIFLFLGLGAVVLRYRLHRGAWEGWCREALDPRLLGRVLAFGFPVAAQISLELAFFAISAFLAGHLGELALASHTIVITLASLTFMVPLGISIGAVTRVGNRVGARDYRGAQQSAWVACGFAAVFSLVSAAIFLLGRHQLPALFTDDAATIALAASILPIAAAFQLFDGVQVVGGGILRGMGRTRPAAVFNLIGYYLLALPCSWWLAFRLDWQVHGLWWAMCVGLGAVSVLLVLWIHRRGPASLIE